MSNMGAISGILINNDYIEVISSNIANASTIGYKSSKPVFFDMFSNSFYSNSTNGYGVGISNIIQNFNNGMLIETGRDLDLGIMHDGFFRVLDAQGYVHYTRNGQFILDRNENIVNMQGMYLTGHNQSYSKNTCHNASSLEPINLKHAHILKAKPTSEITLKAILNRNAELVKTNSSNSLSKLEDHQTYPINIYDKEGQTEKINISFSKKNKDTWKVHVESNDFNESKEKNINNDFEIKFNSHDELSSNNIFRISLDDSKYKAIDLNLTGTIEQSNANNDNYEEYFQNGYSEGSLKTFNIFPNGEIIGLYSNEQTQTIGQILLSKFINPEKLKPESGNVWSATAESGTENIGMAGDSGFGVLSEKTLEASNVDLNKELINMIIAQRNYQSNAQSFKTEDKIISTLINLR